VFFGLPDDAVALREGLREVLASVCTPATIRATWDGDASDDLWKELGSFGLLGLLVEEPRGGLGLDELAFVAAMEECGYAGVPGPLVETIAALPELDLPLDGSARVAVRRNWVGVAGATTATHVLDLIADGPRLLTSPEVQPLETVDLARGLGHVVGEGEPVALDEQRLQQRAVLGTAAFLCGLARRQVDLTVEYLKTRKQFGVAIGSFQGLKHPLAEAVVGTEFAWPVVLHAAHTMSTRDISHAKAAAGDAAYRVSRVCLQAHGAMGYTVEYDLHLFMKRTWALAKDWGTAAEHRARIAEELL
jgi:alkylation response protein AidB-like acyl-CoA dehydrogenase